MKQKLVASLMASVVVTASLMSAVTVGAAESISANTVSENEAQVESSDAVDAELETGSAFRLVLDYIQSSQQDEEALVGVSEAKTRAELTKQINSLKAQISTREANYNQGMIGFVRWYIKKTNEGAASGRIPKNLAEEYLKDANKALEELTSDKKYTDLSNGKDVVINKKTNPSNKDDAVNIHNVYDALRLIDEGNQLRKQDDPKLKNLGVSLYTMAFAEVAANYSAFSMDHTSGLDCNLAWGPVDPYMGWYNLERSYNGGHYRNLMNGSHTVTGFGLNYYGSMGLTAAQVFDYGYAAGSAKELAEILNQYYADECYTDNLKKQLKDTQDKLDSLTKQSMYRLYNPNSGEHFYTVSAQEKAHLVSVGWNDEGIGWYAPKKSTTPVYRLYNPNAGDHHYTFNENERKQLISVGWNDEGIGWYSDDAKGVALYRQYNPNAKSGSHNYTTNKNENDHLVRIGWKEEGIGWYGMK